MSQPVISLLMPFKHASQYLEECIQSIQEQTFANWELIAVDDHSEDNGAAIVASLQKRDKRIRLLQNKGKGIISALQTAFEMSRGAFVSRMDADDKMPPQRLQIQHDQLQDRGLGHIALGQVRYFSNVPIGQGYQNYERWINHLTESGTNFSDLYKECVIPSPCWMVHREDLINCGAFDSKRYPEDYDLTFRFYAAGLKCIPNRAVLHFWRDYPSRTSRTHEHYAQNSFLDLKCFYFLKLHHEASRPLVIWGAGWKGKEIAKLLIGEKKAFHWICDNPKKIGKKIYGKVLHPIDLLDELKAAQHIVAVANPEAQKEIRKYLNDRNLKALKDHFFFC